MLFILSIIDAEKVRNLIQPATNVS